MKAYVQTDRAGDYYNVNAYLAAEGFTTLGWEVVKFHTLDDLHHDPNPEALVAGGIGHVRGRLAQLGIAASAGELDYPAELTAYLGRKVWPSTIKTVYSRPEAWNVFIKPRTRTKVFTGLIVREAADFIGLIAADEDTEVWCSEPVQFITEWRCFIRYGAVLDIRRYKGCWDTRLDLSVVESAVRDFTSAPAAYGMDFGVDAAGVMRLVEVNDGHSLGSYGMGAVDYAKFLAARWAELTGTQDWADF